MNTKLQSLTNGEVGTPAFQAIVNELIGIAQRIGHVKVRSANVAGLPVGTLVTVVGYDPAPGSCLLVDKADATIAEPTLARFVISEAITGQGYGIAYTAGIIGGLNTAASAGVGFPAYLGASGAFVFTPPAAAGNLVQQVGVVTIDHASAGAISFFPGAVTQIAALVENGLVGTAALTHVRGGKITLNGVNPTRVLFQAADAATILGTDNGATKTMDNGQTLVVNPDGDGDDTVTFAAAAATSVSDASPSTNISGETDTKFQISIDDDDAEEVELTLAGLTTGELIAAEMQTKIRALGGTKASVTVAYTTVYTITSATKGTGSHVVVTNAVAGSIAEELKIGVANGGVETAGTGDAVNIAAATAAEIAAAIAARATGWTATAEGNKVRITSETTGLDSSLVVNAGSTADTILGITGAAYGAQGLGYATDMADALYLVEATLNGVGQGDLAAKELGVTTRSAAGFSVECETAAASHDVDLVIIGVPA